MDSKKIFSIEPLTTEEKQKLDEMFTKEIEKGRDEYLKDYLDKYKDIKFKRNG